MTNDRQPIADPTIKGKGAGGPSLKQKKNKFQKQGPQKSRESGKKTHPSSLRFPREMIRTKYWRLLNGLDVVCLTEIASYHNGYNNGSIYLPRGQAANRVGCRKQYLCESIDRCLDFGFLEITREHYQDSAGRRFCAEYLITFLPLSSRKDPGTQWSCGKIQLKRKGEVYVAIPNMVLHSREYRALPWVSKLILILLCFLYDGRNNGMIEYSPAQIMRDYPEISRQRLHNAFKALTASKFIKITNDTSFHHKGGRRTVEITFYRTGIKPLRARPSNAWKWDF